MLKKLLIFLFFVVLTVIITWPLILHLNTLIIDKQDGLLITWFLNWSIFHPLNFNANIFYPFKNTLAFSETMLAEAFLVAPFVYLFKEPLLAYNLNFLLGFILTGFSMYLFLKYLTNDDKVSFLIAVVFNFSAIHIGFMPHLQLFNFWPVIFSTMFLLQKRYIWFIIFFWIASLTTALFFYFLLLVWLVYFFSVMLEGVKRPIASLQELIKDSITHFVRSRMTPALIISIIITVPFLIPYYLVSRQFHYVRPITDAINFSLAPSDLLIQFFPGWAFLVLCCGAILGPQLARTASSAYGALYKGAINRTTTIFKAFLVISLVSFVLAFGPALHIVKNTVHIGPLRAFPLPYAIAYYLVPGFSGFRTPSRFMLLAFFATCTALAILLKGKINKSILILLLLLTLLPLFGIYFPIKFQSVPSIKDFPPEQIWLKNNYVGVPIVQFPIYGWWDDPGVKIETLREYYSTIHWHPMYNGYSGFSPKEWEDSIPWLQKNFPSLQTVEFLKAKGVKLVLVSGQTRNKINLTDLLQLIQSFPETNVYKIQ